MRNDVWQYIKFVNISAYAKSCQTIPHGSRDRTSELFPNLDFGKTSTNWASGIVLFSFGRACR